MLAELRELWSFRELLFTMVQRELRVRYKNSILGFLWSFLNPLCTTAVMTVVFGRLLHNGVHNYSAYLLAALLPFNFFQSAVMDSAQSILGSLSLVKKIYFPREILPLAAIISNFIHLVLGFFVFALLLLLVWALNPTICPFQATSVFLPVLLLISLLFTTGFSLLIAALNTYYEDVKYLTGLLLYLLFFLCPIMYFIEQVGNSNEVRQHAFIFKLYNLNPVAVLSTGFRKVLLAPQPINVTIGSKLVKVTPYPIEWGWIAYSGVVSLIMLYVGYAVFNKLKWGFVERP